MGETVLLLTLATSLAASLPDQSQSPARTAKNSAGQSTQFADMGMSKRRIPCKTPENALVCYWTHGRLSIYQGNPTLRIWKIGTHRMLGIYNGPSHFPPHMIADDENPELPANLDHAYLADRRLWEREGTSDHGFPDIFADFEVCPLEPEKQGWMQAACVESSRNIFVQKGWR